MSPRARVYGIVGATCVAAGALAAGIVVAGGGGDGRAQQPAGRSGPPPLELDLGVRGDGEAVALRRAQELYRDGRVRRAADVFDRYRSVEAEVGAAMAAWPAATTQRLEALARSHPRSALVHLNLGLSLLWSGRDAEALAAWREAKRVEPDSASAVRADDLLHPDYNRGLPTFVPSFRPPPDVTRLAPTRQLAVLARRAKGPDVRWRLLYGIALQRLGRPLSAERVFAEAAARAPGNTDAQVAAAVGRFDKDRPERAFSRLGPLTRRFPHASTVRFHLGLLLLWLGEVDEGRRQLRLARAEAPRSLLGREAGVFLRRLEKVGK